MNGNFDELDRRCAALLDISVEEYIRKIEQLPTFTMLAVIYGLLSDDPSEIKESRILFEEETKDM
jgi:hypothetical protein